MNVIAKEDTTLYCLHKNIVQSLIDSSTEFREQFIRLISDNTARIGEKIKSDFKETLRHKIEKYLIGQMKIQNSNIIELAASKTQLAQYFGVERTSFSRELQKMRKSNLIRFDRRTITVLF